MEFRGQIRNGMVAFEVPPPLPEGTKVEVCIVEDESKIQTTPAAHPTVWDKLLELAGTVE